VPNIGTVGCIKVSGCIAFGENASNSYNFFLKWLLENPIAKKIGST
jgi:hypothetical protein